MKHRRLAEEQVIGVLPEQEARLRTADLCHRQEIPEGWENQDFWNRSHINTINHLRFAPGMLERNCPRLFDVAGSELKDGSATL